MTPNGHQCRQPSLRSRRSSVRLFSCEILKVLEEFNWLLSLGFCHFIETLVCVHSFREEIVSKYYFLNTFFNTNIYVMKEMN